MLWDYFTLQIISYIKENKCGISQAGQRGFLVLCNDNEAKAVAEAYSLLGHYADGLYGPGKVSLSLGKGSKTFSGYLVNEAPEKCFYIREYLRKKQ